MTKKKYPKKKVKNIFFFMHTGKFAFFSSIIFAIIGISITILASQQKALYSDSSLTGEEAIEEQQNTIPNDVIAQIKQQEKVLGAKTKIPGYTVVLPTSIHVPILMYHYIEYVQDPGDKIRISLNSTPYRFEQEIKTLADAGYTFITNAELSQALDGKRQLPSKPIV